MLTKPVFEIKFSAPRKQAEVAELADALRSGRSEGSLMWVQVPPSAQERLANKRVFLLSPSRPPGTLREAYSQSAPNSQVTVYSLGSFEMRIWGGQGWGSVV